ncbi:hypothetical protein Pfo_000590 [Paulownia fortunei]|nr:hypothetical protein Pfo_000590 [Paulownia fortunei]
MNNTFPKEHVVDIDFDTSPCVFRVPKSLTQTKPEAYAPQQVGLGPYHHLRPELHTMQRKKVAAIRKFLNADQLQNFQLVVEALMKLEPLVRACYDQYLDLDPRTLAWILAIDAMYLLQFWKNYSGRSGEAAAKDTGMENLAGDILMLENQIPVILFKEILRIPNLSPGDDHDMCCMKNSVFFCREASPLKLNEQGMDIVDMRTQGHLLNVTYKLIVTNRGIQDPEPRQYRRSMGTVYENLKLGAEIAAAGGVPGAEIAQKQLLLMEKVPWDRIFDLFKTGDPDEQNSSVEEINIPSVSQLTDIAGIRFALTPGGIRDVKFNEEKRNSISLISQTRIHLELAEYVDLMCGIVDILRKEKIIISDLSDAEIACILNGIKKLTGNNEKTTNIEKAIEKVNEQYDNIPRVKAYRFIKKHVYSSWKFLTVLSTVMVLALLMFQAFCQVYGCSKRWFK